MNQDGVDQYLISDSATILAAMQKIDGARVKLCIIKKNDGTIWRTATDGDLRRALLNGATVDSPLSTLEDKDPIFAPLGSHDYAILETMRNHDIQAILVADENGEITKVVARQELEGNLLLSPPHLGSTELSYIQRALDDNWVAPAGPNLIQFEHALAKKTQRSNALALSSGSAALHLALRVLNIRDGARVYVSDLTFAASLQPILYERAEPVLIDADPFTWNMSTVALEKQLVKDKTSGNLPKAIIVVHLYGQSAEMQSICSLAEKFGVPIVEDSAESLGASYDKRPSGSHGSLSAYSFNGNKIITTSGGGALVSDNNELIEYARKLSTQGRDNAEHYQHSEVAYNYRMSNILAGIGIGQLQVLNDRVKRRQEIFALYRDQLSEIDGIDFQQDSKNGVGSRWLTVITMDPRYIDVHPYVVMRRLRDTGIESRPCWKPMHMQPLCRHMEFVTHNEYEAVSSSLFLRSLCLPSGSAMSDLDVRRVSTAIKKVIRED